MVMSLLSRTLQLAKDCPELRQNLAPLLKAARTELVFYTEWRHQVESHSMVSGLDPSNTRKFIAEIKRYLDKTGSDWEFVNLSDWDQKGDVLELTWFTGGEMLSEAGKGTEAIKAVARKLGYSISETTKARFKRFAAQEYPPSWEHHIPIGSFDDWAHYACNEVYDNLEALEKLIKENPPVKHLNKPLQDAIKAVKKVEAEVDKMTGIASRQYRQEGRF